LLSVADWECAQNSQSVGVTPSTPECGIQALGGWAEKDGRQPKGLLR